jgi:hypothetical protein
LQAFQKIYIFLSKKKFSFKNLIVLIIVIILKLPLKILKLFYYFICLKNMSYLDGLEILYFKLFYLLKNLKIEILNNKIYLNCFSLGQLIHHIKQTNLTISNEKLFLLILNLKNASLDFYNYENLNQNMVKFNLTKAFDKNNSLIYNYHYTYIEKFNSIHATSNIPEKLEIYQKIDSAIPRLIKSFSNNPGTIITESVVKFENKSKFILVPEYELDSIKYNHKNLFNLNNKNHDYIKNKSDIYIEILKDNVDNALLNNLRSNNYTVILNNSSESDILNEINILNPNL